MIKKLLKALIQPKVSTYIDARNWIQKILLEVEISKIKSPFETLSPTFTLMVSILPENVDGISTLDLSLSIVIIGSFFLISCPSLTRSSMTSTF